MSTDRKYFNSIQFLKLIACLGIIFGHCFCLSNNKRVADISGNLGGFGNNIFFLISGFLLYFSDFELKNIGIKTGFKKISKLYPLHILMLVAWVLVDVVYGLILHDFSFFSYELILKFVADSLLVQSLIPISSYYHSLNAVSWYLSCFFWIMVFYPLVLRLIKKIDGVFRNILIVICILCLIYIPSIFLQFSVKTWLLGISPFWRVLYVALGSFLAKLYKYLDEKIKKQFFLNSFLILIDLLIIGLLIFYDKGANFLLLLECLLILLLSFETDILKFVYQNKFVIFISKQTPYVFLIHYCLIKYVSGFSSVLNIYIHPMIFLLLVVILSFICSILYNLIISKLNKRSLRIER